MPRFLIERTFPNGLQVPMTLEGANACLNVVDKNGNLGVTWIHSYVSSDKRKTFCVYDGPDEAAIREAAESNSLPIDAITEVRVLDPYFYH